MKQLKDVKWKAFELYRVFPLIQRGKRLKNGDHIVGKMPYVSSSAQNNGVDDFVSNDENVRIFNNCISWANSGSVGEAFYHPYHFVASDHVTELKMIAPNKYVYLFITASLEKQRGKYSFNREIKDARISREKILLPTSDGESPDYAFMEQYMRSIEKELLGRYKRYCEMKEDSTGGVLS